jgi:pimeloyl-ACP methyl ester carboxylesterase
MELRSKSEPPKSYRWVGELQGRKIEGQFIQADGKAVPFWLGRQRIETAHIPVRPQTPAPPYPYDSKDVSFTVGNVVRAGTLTRPRGTGPYPAVFLIQGSGGGDRDYTSVTFHKPFLVLSDALTRAGAVVLRADSRGFGTSGGKDEDTTLDEHVADVAAAIRLLRAQPGIAPDRVGVIGFSRGGVVAATAASQQPEMNFVILLSTPARAWVDVDLDRWWDSPAMSALPRNMVQQFQRTVRRGLVEQAELKPTEQLSDERLLAIVQEEYSGEDEVIQRRMLASLRELLSKRGPVRRSFMAYDPQTVFPKIHGRVFAIFGEKDNKFHAFENAQLLRDLLHKDVATDEVVVIPKLNHALRTVPGDHREEASASAETLNEQVIETIVGWIVRGTARD